MPCNTAWYTHLDEVLESHHVPLRFFDLIARLPVPIPEPDDWQAGATNAEIKREMGLSDDGLLNIIRRMVDEPEDYRQRCGED